MQFPAEKECATLVSMSRTARGKLSTIFMRLGQLCYHTPMLDFNA
jgi:hypothetical protein